MKTAYIMIGVSGSGKSTWAEDKVREFERAAICSADQYFMQEGNYLFDYRGLGKAHGQCLRNFIDACQKEYDGVVCDNTNTTVEDIAPYMAVAQAYGYTVEVIHMEATPAVAAIRNSHGVPLKAIQGMDSRISYLLANWPRRWPTVTCIPEES